MTISWKVRALDAARRATRGGVADMSLAEIRAARRSRLPQLPIGNGLLERAGRLLFGAPRPSVTIRATTVEGAAGQLPARLYTPVTAAGSGPLIVYFHGGGWTVGSPRHYDWLCTALAEDAAARVVSIDYRKAPEHPAPAAHDDAVTSFRWVSQHRHDFGVDGPIAVAGDSAGGNLAALVAIAARDHEVDLAAQALIYPGVDLTQSFPSIHQKANAPILPRVDVDAFRDHYLSGDVEPHDPRVSPWFVDDVSGLAPALIQTAEHDPLVDEGEAYATKLAEAGVTVRHTRYVDAPHGFVSIPGVVPAARQAAAETAAFLDDHLAR